MNFHYDYFELHIICDTGWVGWRGGEEAEPSLLPPDCVDWIVRYVLTNVENHVKCNQNV